MLGRLAVLVIFLSFGASEGLHAGSSLTIFL